MLDTYRSGFLDEAKDTLEGVDCLFLQAVEGDGFRCGPTLRRFITKFYSSCPYAQHNNGMSQFERAAYDTISITSDLASDGHASSSELVDLLHSRSNHNGLTGPIKFTSEGEAVRTPRFYKVTHNELEIVRGK